MFIASHYAYPWVEELGGDRERAKLSFSTVIELGLIGAEERANWNRLRCMPRRVVPYRVAERYLAWAADVLAE